MCMLMYISYAVWTIIQANEKKKLLFTCTLYSHNKTDFRQQIAPISHTKKSLNRFAVVLKLANLPEQTAQMLR